MPLRRKQQNLTVNCCNKATFSVKGRGRDIRWDSVVTSLGLRIYPTGRKVWVTEYRDEARRRRMMTLAG